MITAVVISDGRGDYLRETLSTFHNLQGLHERGVLVDDSGDAMFAKGLEQKYGTSFDVLSHPERCGIGYSVRDGWQHALDLGADFIWHHEQDFIVPQPVDLAELVGLLKTNETLAGLTLKRTAYSPHEHAAGGMIEAAPELFTQRAGYVEFSHLLSFNPTLFPADIIRECLFNDGPFTENAVGEFLVGLGYHFGIVGEIDDWPLVEHIGTERAEGWRE